MLSSEIQSYIWENCHKNLSNGQQHLVSCESPIEESLAQSLVEEIVNEEKMIRLLRFWITNQKVTTVVAKVDRQSAFDLADKVNQFIQRN